MPTYPIILAIDTSCDDTSVAVTQGMRVLSNVVASQTELHRKYGGVMPLVAKLAHHETINPTYQETLKRARIKPDQIDILAVTYGPGLAIALEVGIEFAKVLSQELQKPLIAVNHMAGHLYSSLAVNAKGSHHPVLKPSRFPLLALLVSGGHSDLLIMKSLTYGDFAVIGKTLDDAAGECLDKFARLLDLGYPGAPVLEQLAKKGDPLSFPFPLPMTQTLDFNYSFSGLKTAGRHAVQAKNSLTKKDIENLAASFQQAVFRALIYKLKKAMQQYLPKTVFLGGGVVANVDFRKQVRLLCKTQNIDLKYPVNKRLMGDNAAMIGIAAYFQYLQGDIWHDSLSLHRVPRLSL